MSKKIVFIVDDDPEDVMVLAEAAADKRCEVRAFSDPLRFLAAATAERPDVAVVDLAMPWIDGKDVITSLRMRYPGIPVIVVSGLPGAVDMKLDIVAFYPKPVLLKAFRKTLKKLLG